MASLGGLTPAIRMLYGDWVRKFAQDRWGHVKGFSSSGSEWKFPVAAGWNVVVDAGTGALDGPPEHRRALRRIAYEARLRAHQRDVGETPTLWAFEFESRPSDFGDAGVDWLFSRRIDGTYAIDSAAIVDIHPAEAWTGRPHELKPKFAVRAWIRVPSPTHGPYGTFVARERANRLRVLLTFLTRTPIDPHVLWATEPEEGTLADAPAFDGQVPQLMTPEAALPSQLLNEHTPDGDPLEAVDRLYGALTAYAEAIAQRNRGTELVLLIVAADALAQPNADWRRHGGITQRFRHTVAQAAPKAVEDMMRHDNFAQFFGHMTSPRRLLEDLYDLRSRALHEGAFVSLASVAGNVDMRTELVRVLVESVIYSFGVRPFSCLDGHPSFDEPGEPTEQMQVWMDAPWADWLTPGLAEVGVDLMRGSTDP